MAKAVIHAYFFFFVFKSRFFLFFVLIISCNVEDRFNVLLQLLRVTGILSIPVWYNAGAVKYGFANTETLIIVQLLLMG